MEIGDIFQRKFGQIIEVQGFDEMFVAFTYGGPPTYFLGHDEFERRFQPVRPEAEAPHPDDIAVDRFAAAMKAKLAEKRAEGRGGWEDKAACPAERLTAMLRNHVEKGDPLDVANFAMMLHERGETIGAGGAPDPEPFVAYYRNWRGEVEKRWLMPIRAWFGATDWHPEPQWLLTAWDCNRRAERDFALKDFHPHEAAFAGAAETEARLGKGGSQ